MGRVLVASLVLGVVASGCQTTPAPATAGPGPAAQPAAAPPNRSHIPAGTVFMATLNDDLSRSAAKIGDTFTVEVQHPLVAQNRDTVVAVGSVITGMVTGIGGEGQQSALRLNFTRIAVDGASHPFTAAITALHVPEDRRAAEGAERGAAGDSVGVARGAVIGEGPLRDALVGGALGAGAGTIISLGSGPDAVLPAGTQLTLQTAERIELQTR